MKFKLSRILLAVSALGVTSITANASEPESSWQLADSSLEENAKMIFAEVEASPSIALHCSEKVGIRAVIYLNGDSLNESEFPGDARLKSRNVSLSTPSLSKRVEPWGYIRSGKILISAKGWPGKRIYNSAISGEPLTTYVTRVGSVDLVVPAVDDNFKTFASSCAAIR